MALDPPSAAAITARAGDVSAWLIGWRQRPSDTETYRPLSVEEDLDRYDLPDPTLTLAEARALAALQLVDGKHAAS